ncbi:MerR family transcriptional regulator, partial [Anaerotruncus colihominis]|uniref:MerR family transcriptional regulator n=1 Tax=Anaerotruncus colihominis TaxID=169435 RepID=UPI00210B9B5A
MKGRKKRYTIGEVAALLNISPQTLRFYDNSGVVAPGCTDQTTGYRYYNYDQIGYISRVKYLQQFGFSLDEIREALASNTTHKFKAFLQSRRQILQAESERIK